MLEFFKTLYAFCEDGQIELRALPSRKRVFLTLDNMQSIGDFCRENAKDHLYYGIALRDGGGTKENITQIPCTWVDVDYKTTPREVLLEKLKSFPFKPSMIVKSGGGVHLYFLLKEPADKTDIEQIEDVNRRIAAQIGGDLNATDAARIFRIPGTVNHKYPEKPVCEVTQKNENYYCLDDFLDLLPPVENKKPSENSQESRQCNWLSKAMTGQGEGQRNATGAKLAGYWINKVSSDDVLTILTTWNLNNKPPLPDSELKEIVKSVSSPSFLVSAGHEYN